MKRKVRVEDIVGLWADAPEQKDIGQARPSYEELATAFWEYLAASNNDGDPVAAEDDDVTRAYEVLARTGVDNPYPYWGVESG